MNTIKPFLSLLFLGCSNACGSSSVTASPPPDPTQQPVTLALQTVASGLNSPVHMSSPVGDARLFVVEQLGRIRIIQNGQLLATPFLDITGKVQYGGEQGLLSVAFHPSYATNRFFFVYYTDLAGEIRIERYTASASNPNVADAASTKVILTIPHPNSNHNGGLAMFGKDGLLYLGTGDGGGGGDPQNNGQNRNVLLGKLLRIDINSAGPYDIPPGNPFVGESGARGEVWALGLRNPWRYSFDRTDDILYIGDVGQNSTEEVNAVSSAQAGVNYGWRIMEGTSCFNAGSCNQAGLTLPVHTYPLDGGNCAVTGGYAYRGSAIPQIAGVYFFSDYCKGGLRSFRLVNGAATGLREWDVSVGALITSFAEDSSGELYILAANGTVRKIVAGS